MAGDAFAYRVEIEIAAEGATTVERFVGSPYFTVRQVDASGHAQLFAIGKFSCSSRSGEQDEETLHPGRAFWIGSRVEIEATMHDASRDCTQHNG